MSANFSRSVRRTAGTARCRCSATCGASGEDTAPANTRALLWHVSRGSSLYLETGKGRLVGCDRCQSFFHQWCHGDHHGDEPLPPPWDLPPIWQCGSCAEQTRSWPEGSQGQQWALTVRFHAHHAFLDESGRYCLMCGMHVAGDEEKPSKSNTLSLCRGEDTLVVMEEREEIATVREAELEARDTRQKQDDSRNLRRREDQARMAAAVASERCV